VANSILVRKIEPLPIFVTPNIPCINPDAIYDARVCSKVSFSLALFSIFELKMTFSNQETLVQIASLSTDKDGYLHAPSKLTIIGELAQLKKQQEQQESLKKMHLFLKEMYQKVLKVYAHSKGENQVLKMDRERSRQA